MALIVCIIIVIRKVVNLLAFYPIILTIHFLVSPAYLLVDYYIDFEASWADYFTAYALRLALEQGLHL